MRLGLRYRLSGVSRRLSAASSYWFGCKTLDVAQGVTDSRREQALTSESDPASRMVSRIDRSCLVAKGRVIMLGSPFFG